MCELRIEYSSIHNIHRNLKNKWTVETFDSDIILVELGVIIFVRQFDITEIKYLVFDMLVSERRHPYEITLTLASARMSTLV